VITEKDQLFNNIAKNCEINHRAVTEVLPITFVIDFTQKTHMESAIDKFT
jgi:hypothetical protein